MISFSHSAIERVISTEHQKTYNDVQALSRAFHEYQLQADRIREIPKTLFAQYEVTKNNMSLVPPRWSGDPEQTPHLMVWCSEQLGYGDAALAFSMPGPSLTMPVTQAIATEKQVDWFVSLFREDTDLRWGAFALSERGLGSDFSHMKTIAERRGDRWILRGMKNYIGNAPRAGMGVVFANASPDKGRFGIRAFFVDFRQTRISDMGETMHGLRCLKISDVEFDEIEIPLENILGFDNGVLPKRDAFAAAQGSFNFMRPMLAAAICGTTRRMIEILRMEFSKNTTVLSVLDDLSFDTESALALCYKAALDQDHGIDTTLSSAVAKYEACQVNHRICSVVAQRFGASLMQSDNARIEKLFRDSYCFRFMEGTEDNQRSLISQISVRRMRFHKLARRLEPATDVRVTQDKIVAKGAL